MNLEQLKNYIPYKWKVQTCNKKQTQLVAYVDSRDVQNRLDEACGPHNWADRYYEVDGNTYCEILINVGGGWVGKSDCGVEAGHSRATDDIKIKGQASDAFKRAGVKWGIFRFGYDLDFLYLKSTNHPYKKDAFLPSAKTGGNPIWNVDQYVRDNKLDGFSNIERCKLHIIDHLKGCSDPGSFEEVEKKLRSQKWWMVSPDEFTSLTEDLASKMIAKENGDE